MRILHTVEQYHPNVGGMQEVVKRLSELLVQRGHEVTVATRKEPGRQSLNINGVKIVEFDIRGNEVNGYKGPDIQKYRDFLIQSNFDIVTCFAAQQWAADLVYEILPKIRAKKVFVPTGFSGFYDPLYQVYFKNLYKHMRKFDAHVFLSDDYRDIYYARGHRVKNLYLIPNGASEAEFTAPAQVDVRKKLGIPEDHFLILHVGSHTGMKGHHLAINIFRQAKIDKATLLIVGNSYEDGGCYKECLWRADTANRWPQINTLGNRKTFWNSVLRRTLKGKIFDKIGSEKKVMIEKLTREETVAAYHAADLFLFPSQIECSPIVFFECMASRTPFLTTDVGNAAEIIRWSESGEILPTYMQSWCVTAIVDHCFPVVERYYRDPGLRERMAEAGYQAWRRYFTWEKIAAQYEELYRSLGESHPAAEMNTALYGDV